MQPFAESHREPASMAAGLLHRVRIHPLAYLARELASTSDCSFSVPRPWNFTAVVPQAGH